MWDGLSNRVLCDVGVIAVALCPPGMMCKLDCPWMSRFLFVSLGAAIREHLVLTVLHRDCWEPGGIRVLVFPRDVSWFCIRISHQNLA